MSLTRFAFNWPNWRKPSGLPPGQPYDGYLRDMRRAWKKRDHDRRELLRAIRRDRKL